MVNKGKYCHIEGGLVDLGPKLLPQNWEGSNNINNTDTWDDARLATIDWLPYVLVDTGAPGPYYTRTLSAFNIQATEVTQTAEYTQWDIEQVRAQKNAELESSITIIDANQLASDVLIRYSIQDENEWVATEKAKLARFETWQEVADFDTSKPEILPLSNTYVGKQYVRQGTELTAENTAAVDAGLTTPYDAPTLSAFITANTLAAEDSSGGTPPVDPDYKLRQGVAVVSEGASQIWIYRYQRAGVNPVTDFNYRIKLISKRDLRQLYVFSYANGGTYLTWHPLVLQPDGSWTVEGGSTEWQYAPGDMSFIFSYGTNPAVEADYFTEKVEFPAGVNEQVRRIRWNKGTRVPSARIRR